MKKKFLILSLILLFFSSNLVDIISAKAVSQTSQQAGYYGYESRNTIVNALVEHSEIPEWKQSALIDKLSVDGYFWMKTKQEKLNYIHANLPNNKYLSVVADAENIHSWNVNDQNVPEVFVTDSSSSQATNEEGIPSIAGVSSNRASTSSKDYQALLNEANTNLSEWVGFAQKAFANSSKCLPKAEETGWFEGVWGSIKGEYPEANKYRPTIGQAFATKSCWDSSSLSRLYSYYWPDMKRYQSKRVWWEPEKPKLAKRWGAIGSYLSAYPDDKPLKEVGLTGDSPIDDVLLFLPVDRIAVWGGKGVVKGVKYLGSKIAKREIAIVGSKVVEEAGEKYVLEAGEKLVQEQATDHVLAVEINNLALGRRIKYNFSKIFLGYSLSRAQELKIIRALDDGLSDTIQSLKSRGFNKASERLKALSPEISDRVEVLTPKALKRKFPKYDPSRTGAVVTETKVYYNEAFLISNDPAVLKTITFHEIQHIATAPGVIAAEGTGSAYRPFVEALNEANSVFAGNITEYSSNFVPYPQEMEVMKEIINLGEKKFGQAKTWDILGEAQYEEGLNWINNQYGIHDFWQTASEKMKASDFQGAMAYVKGFE